MSYKDIEKQKACKSAYMKKYYQANKPRRSALCRAWREKNREYHKARMKEYNKRYKEKRKSRKVPDPGLLEFALAMEQKRKNKPKPRDTSKGYTGKLVVQRG
jgi:hypothetical protein